MSKTPSSTYRIQLNKDFDFDACSAVADYLASLGISHVYTSPCLQTAPGSSHGYDVADFKQVNVELGGETGRERFSQRLKQCGLGHVLDIVPNHMSLTQNNPYWQDVLENGPASQYAEYFDIDWNMGEAPMRNKVLLPVLGEQYGIALKAGDIQLERQATSFRLVHGGQYLPVAPSSLSMILESASQIRYSDRLSYLADAFKQLARREQEETSLISQLQRDRRALLSILAETLAAGSELLAAIDEAICAINKNVDQLDDFLQRQHYRVAYWRTADQELGYRRFFDVNSLIGVRVEKENVFLDTHEIILDWLREGVIDGIRADHADGLRDPQRYFERLLDLAPLNWIVAEKILARSETLPETWPIAGTTGYNFLNVVNGLFVSAEGLAALDTFYTEIRGSAVDIPTLVHQKKIAITTESLGSDVNWLASLFVEICEGDRDHRDYTRAQIRHAIREVASCFPVYRSYVMPDRAEVSELDAAVIQSAIDVAAQYRPDIDRGLFDFIGDVLLLRKRGRRETDFLLRFQQFTSPVMAKGLEDSSLYCYNRLIGLNEVGCDLSNPLVSVDEFHRFNLQAQQAHPLGMTTLTTHDTKRGEDVRARLAVLSELPEQFRTVVSRWQAMNRAHNTNQAIDPNTEYFLYQTLIGAWPLSPDRATAYMLKATREAKEQTSWTHNNEAFEKALRDFIKATLNSAEFCAEVESFVGIILGPGRINSLAQTLIKYTSPGVPDLYQGSELWELRLVDPDNRTPVDYQRRRQLLTEMQNLTAKEVMARMDEGLPKLWTIQKALSVRRQYGECFNASGDYVPIEVAGAESSRVVAYLRGGRVATIVPRLSMGHSAGWLQTEVMLPDGRWTNVLTGASINGGHTEVAPLFAEFPVALLTREDA